MENKKRSYFRLLDKEKEIRQALSEGRTFQFYPKGTSMEPFIHQSQDMVVVSALPDDLKKYQLVLYKRTNGDFVLHRIVKKNLDTYTMRGDNQFVDETGVKKDQMIGVIKQMIRNGNIIELEHGKYRMYTICWVNTMKIRCLFIRIKNYLSKIKRWMFGRKKNIKN